jgi:hypothetical protein
MNANSAELIFAKAWFAKTAENERVRVITKIQPLAKSDAWRVHDCLNMALFAEEKGSWSLIEQAWKAVGMHLADMAKSAQAEKHFRALASLVKKHPPSASHLDFNGWSGFPSFTPAASDGIKPVMLKAFFDLMSQRSDMTFPTIGELDSYIRKKWKWHGDEKELRDARRELGLSGLPRGKGGRPKKQRGKK